MVEVDRWRSFMARSAELSHLGQQTKHNVDSIHIFLTRFDLTVWTVFYTYIYIYIYLYYSSIHSYSESSN